MTPLPARAATVLDVDFVELAPAPVSRRLVRRARAAVGLAAVFACVAVLPGTGEIPAIGAAFAAAGLAISALPLHVAAALAAGRPAWRLDAAWRRRV